MTWMLVLILPLYLATIHAALGATAEQWRSRRIYQLLTDRFAVTTGTVAAPCVVASRTYCAGSWKGIQEHLDYISNLGFDAVWISPVVANVEGTSAYGQAYHGYWAEDITKLNSHFGTPYDLKQLIRAIHSAGMYVMLDVVANHFAVIPYNGQLDFSHIVPFSSSTNFHRKCFILPSDYSNNQTAVEQCWLGDDKLPLVDLDTENPAIVKTMQNWIKNLVTTYDIDGIRIDTVKHVRKDFWPAFASAAGVYTLGEVFDGSVDYVAEYTKVIDGILDYPTYFTVNHAFSSSSPDLSAVVDVVTKSQKSYKNGLFFSGSFLENHDQPRFQSHTKDIALVKNAIAWPFVNDGLPILYYGQEQGFHGGDDPSNREPMWTSGYVKNTPLATHVRYLNIARKLAGRANGNFYTTAARFIHQNSPSLLAVWKPPLLALLTNIGSTATSPPIWKIPASAKLFKSKEKVVDILTCVVFTADDNGGLSIVAEGGLPKILLPASIVPTTGRGALCPNGASFAKQTSPW